MSLITSRFGPLLGVTLFATLCGACSDTDSGGDDAGAPLASGDPLDLQAATPPSGLSDLNATFYADVAYGSAERNVFDILVPSDADAPTPLVVWIHGGGFTGGSKEGIWDDEGMVQAALDGGAAFASINYRLIQETEDEGVIKPLTDSARAVQFLRHQRADFNIDPERIALMGGSAGAGTALWLNFHDDMADKDATDPVLTHSTRVSAAAVFETQGTYDLVKWSTVVFEEYGFDLVQAADALGQAQALLNFYAISSPDDLERDDIVQYRANVDMLALMDAGDSPFWVDNSIEPYSPPVSVGLAFHHPNHAQVLVDRASEVGLDHAANIPKREVDTTNGESGIDFALRALGL